MRRHGAEVYRGLKTSTAQLVGLLGSQTQVAALKVTRGEQGDLSRWSSINPEHVEQTPRFAPIDVIVDLEHASGDPLVTRYMATCANCILVPLPEGIAEGALAERTGRSAKEFGDVMVRIGEALRDGTISKAEGREIASEIREVMLELSALAEAVKAAIVKDDEQ